MIDGLGVLHVGAGFKPARANPNAHSETAQFVGRSFTPITGGFETRPYAGGGHA